MSRKCASACECCLMPFSQDPLGDKREAKQYCSYCYHHGVLWAEECKNLKDFQKKVFKNMRNNKHSWCFAKIAVFMIRFAPYWKGRAR